MTSPGAAMVPEFRRHMKAAWQNSKPLNEVVINGCTPVSVVLCRLKPPAQICQPGTVVVLGRSVTDTAAICCAQVSFSSVHTSQSITFSPVYYQTPVIRPGCRLGQARQHVNSPAPDAGKWLASLPTTTLSNSNTWKLRVGVD